jgi:predicted dehydrogenase
MAAKVRIGFIGAGGVAQSRHLPALEKIPEAELGPVWTRTASKTRDIVERYGFTSAAATWQEVAESPDVDAVIVATPPVLHRDATIAALSAGKHVLCQARMGLNLSHAQDMLAASRKRNLVTALYPPLPGLKGDRTMLRLLHEEGLVGDIREVRVTGMMSTPESDSYAWQADPAVTGVNAMTLGMWVEILNRWVGPATKLAAIGRTHRGTRTNSDGERVDAEVPDSVAIVADLECGATASYHFSSAASSVPTQTIAIYGSTGALVYDLFGGQIMGATDGGADLAPIDIPEAEVRTQDTDSQFVRAILEGTPVSPDFEEGMRYMEFSEAVALSLKSGEMVSLPPPARMAAWGSYLT